MCLPLQPDDIYLHGQCFSQGEDLVASGPCRPHWRERVTVAFAEALGLPDPTGKGRFSAALPDTRCAPGSHESDDRSMQAPRRVWTDRDEGISFYQ